MTGGATPSLPAADTCSKSRNSDFGGALESITSSKQRKLRLTAEQYMQRETRLRDGRFDVVAMTGGNRNNVTGGYTFEWIKDAF